MEERDLPFQRVIFVCTNQRGKGERVCCAGSGGESIQEALKAGIKDLGLKGRVRVCKAGCMDRCEDGPNVMIHPDNTWLSGVKKSDVPAILARIAEGIEPRGKRKE